MRKHGQAHQKAAPPPSVVPRQAAGRQPRPDIVHSSLYLPESVYEALREIAFRERCKIHDVVLKELVSRSRSADIRPERNADWRTSLPRYDLSILPRSSHPVWRPGRWRRRNLSKRCRREWTMDRIERP